MSNVSGVINTSKNRKRGLFEKDNPLFFDFF